MPLSIFWFAILFCTISKYFGAIPPPGLKDLKLILFCNISPFLISFIAIKLLWFGFDCNGNSTLPIALWTSLEPSTIDCSSSGVAEKKLSAVVFVRSTMKCFSIILAPNATEPIGIALPSVWSDNPIGHLYNSFR